MLRLAHIAVHIILAALLFLPLPALASSKPFIPGHGVNFSTGNVLIQHNDLTLAGLGGGLRWTRSYNSQSSDRSILGYGWTFTANNRLELAGTTPVYHRADGRIFRFTAAGTNIWTTQTGAKATLTKANDGYTLALADQTRLVFNSTGQLTATFDRNNLGLSLTYVDGVLKTITDAQGRSLSLAYNTNNLLQSLSTPAGTFTYTYDAADNLIRVTRPDGKYKSYLYEDKTNSHHLTGIKDETDTLMQSYSYDNRGRVSGSALAGGSDPISIEYQADYKRVVTNSDGVTTYELDVKQGVAQVKSFTGPGCSSCGDSSGSSSYTYDTRQQLTQLIDGRGNKTSYAYDGNGNLYSTTEAVGTTLSRTTTSSYNSTTNLLTSRTEPSATANYTKTTTYTYDAGGNMLTRTVKGYIGTTLTTAITSFAYNSLGQLASITGARNDLNDTTIFRYYANDTSQGNNRAQLHTITNALGQVYTFSDYTSLGKPGSITSPDGQTTTLTYDPNGNVLTQTTSGLTTSFAYDDAGRLAKLTLPGDRILSYSYTDGRVGAITDGLGNSIHYSYDSRGRRVTEAIKDPQGGLRWTLGRAYDAQGNLSKLLFPGNAKESYEYDANRNLTKTIDPVSTETSISYDALDRQLTTTVAGDAISALGYDRQDNVTSVTDARNHITTSTWDDFGNERSIQAPDTGLSKLSYDLAGNLTSKTDVKNQTVAYTYDALNRPVKQTYPNAARDILLTYDTARPGKLSAIQEEFSNRSFTYNNQGQVTAETCSIGSTTATVAYGYDAATGDLASITYPSGRVLSYSRDAMGRITGLQLDGQPLAANIQSLPFGPVASATLGAVHLVREYDQRYQVNRIQAGTFDLQYTRDAAGRVGTVAGLAEPTFTAKSETTAINSANNQITTVGAAAWTHDANGNVTSDGNFVYMWDALNRLIKVEQNGATVASYAYDSQNRRISKTVAGVTTHYVYDLNNQLIAETLTDGTPIRDYFYLSGEPLAVREYQSNPGLYYFVNDHLGTPQQLVTSTGTTVWQAAYLPYGEAQIQTNTVSSNFRFPGQYFDAETGLHYNWNRYYAPKAGRYISADPIGLGSGLNLYTYVNGNPVNLVDLEGLKGWAVDAGGAYGTGWGSETNSSSGMAGTGVYIGTYGDSSYVEIGGFSYTGSGNTAGADIGLGFTLTRYNIPAGKFFEGALGYKKVTFIGGSLIKYYDECGNEVGWSIGILGRGIGFSYSSGKVVGNQGVLQ